MGFLSGLQGGSSPVTVITVKKEGGKWEVRGPGVKNSSHRKKSAAVRNAKKEMKRLGRAVIDVHRADGSFQHRI